jgi:hypothetical protein
VAVGNDAPAAVDDTATTAYETPVVIPVLDNDSDLDGDALHIVSLGTPTSGTVVQNGDGTVTYSPATGASGPATFDYTVADGHGATDVALVRVEVAPLTPGSLGTHLYLGTSGSGNTSSTPVLPFTSDPPTAGSLPNYDTDRDDDPGLFIGNDDDGAGVDEAQIWSEDQPQGLVLAGTARLTFWSAMEDFQTSRRGVVTATLMNCSTGGVCTTVATATLDLPDWSGGSAGWVERTLDFGPVSHTIANGRRLRLRLDVGSNADDDMWFAYGTAAYPSILVVE